MKTTTMIAVAALATGLAACDRDERPEREVSQDTQDVRNKARGNSEAQSEASEAAREVDRERTQFVQGVQSRLRAIEENLDALDKKTETIAYRSKQEVTEAFREVEVARAKLNRDLSRLQSASESEWNELQDQVDDDVDDLEDAVEKADDRIDEIEVKGQEKPENPALSPIEPK